MQSFLQNRRLRRALQDELASKDQSTAGVISRHCSRDVERGEQSSIVREKAEAQDQLPSNGREPSRTTHAASDSTIVDEDNEQYTEKPSEPVEEQPQNDDDDDEEDKAATTLSRADTETSVGHALGQSLTGIDVRRRTTNEGGDGDVFVVAWQGDKDPQNPHSWSITSRMVYTFLIAGIALVVGFASSIDSSALMPASEEFGVSQVVESMATGLFLIGFGCGALFAGPFSELLGRNPVYMVTMVLYMIFLMAAGLAPNIGAQLAFRFISGTFAATPLVCAGGTLADLWNAQERTYAFPIFANAGFLGPVLGPVVGGFIAGASDQITWRWTEWVALIFSGVILILVLLFMPETYAPVLLKWKAQHLRDLTKDDRYRSAIEVKDTTFLQSMKTALTRPFILTVTEPIISLIALYLTVVYIILFTFLDGFVYVFQKPYGLGDGLTGLCFLGIAVGLFCATGITPLIWHWAKKDLAQRKEEGITHLAPEFRLWYAMLGGAVAVPVSLFWMGWTCYPSISIASPLLASVLFGYGILCIFITSYQYVIDSYEIYSASALASMTLIRYVAAGGMTIVGIPFYENLGPHYTCTILACIAAVMVPVPYLFYVYGSKIRARSKYAVDKD